MAFEYKVKSFTPRVVGCGSSDQGWDDARCVQFQEFINEHAKDGWKLHSYEYRHVTVKGCGGGSSVWLVCVFERNG